MKAPIRKFKKFYHVGDMLAQPAPNSRDSHEGPCLSVSQVPEAWRTIARLGNSPLWLLEKAEGQFLNMHGITRALKKTILQWGYDNGFAFEGQAWVTKLAPGEFDDEDDFRFSVDVSLAESLRQCGEVDGEEVLKRYTRLKPFATEKLEAYTEQKVDLLMVFDMLALVYADYVLDIDGLFWNERLDIHSYSAPRAGLLRSKMSSWAIAPAPVGHDTKEEEY